MTSATSLAGQRVLITHVQAFMGPALCEAFAKQGAEVVASTEALAIDDEVQQVVARAGPWMDWSPTWPMRRRVRR